MNTKSNFVGVFTLKTQEEVSALANAVQRLVERSVEVFQMMSGGTAYQLREYMDTINRVSPSFLDLTVDEHERQRAQSLLNSLSSLQASLNGYLTSQNSSVDASTRDFIAKTLGQFLEKVADLCDMMEDNQLNRGALTVQQAQKYVEILSAERPASQVFLPKVNHASTSFTFVDRLLENRISVADEGELKRKLQITRDEFRIAGNDLTNAARVLHQDPRHEAYIEKYKAVMIRIVDLLNTILGMVRGQEVRIKTASAFSHENMNAALIALEDAVKNHDRGSATESAKAVVQEVQQAGSEELKAKTKEVVQATIKALGTENSQSESDLTKALAELKDLASLVEVGGTISKGSIRQNNELRLKLINASKDISNQVEDLFSPRADRFKHLDSPRTASPRSFSSPRHN